MTRGCDAAARVMGRGRWGGCQAWLTSGGDTEGGEAMLETLAVGVGDVTPQRGRARVAEEGCEALLHSRLEGPLKKGGKTNGGLRLYQSLLIYCARVTPLPAIHHDHASAPFLPALAVTLPAQTAASSRRSAMWARRSAATAARRSASSSRRASAVGQSEAEGSIVAG